MPYSSINWTATASPPDPVTPQDDCSACGKCLNPGTATFVWFSKCIADTSKNAPRFKVDRGEGEAEFVYGTALHHCDIHRPSPYKDYVCNGRYSEKEPSNPQTFIWSRKTRKHLGCVYPPSPPPSPRKDD